MAKKKGERHPWVSKIQINLKVIKYICETLKGFNTIFID